jgi:hypothetical protein
LKDRKEVEVIEKGELRHYGQGWERKRGREKLIGLLGVEEVVIYSARVS